MIRGENGSTYQSKSVLKSNSDKPSPGSSKQTAHIESIEVPWDQNFLRNQNIIYSPGQLFPQLNNLTSIFNHSLILQKHRAAIHHNGLSSHELTRVIREINYRTRQVSSFQIALQRLPICDDFFGLI